MPSTKPLKKLLLGLILLLGTPGPFCSSAQAAMVQRLEASQVARLQDAIILDARPETAWAKGHIPGALSFSWEKHLRWEEKTGIRQLNRVEVVRQLGQLGISPTAQLVIYGDTDSSWGGEGWLCWLFSLLGHRGEILLLNGGIQAWQRLGMPLSSNPAPAGPQAAYLAQPRPALNIETEDLAASLQQWQIVDTRAFFEKIRSSIPGAVRIHWRDFYTGIEHRPLTRQELSALLRKNGIDPNRPVVYYCSAGVRSAYAWTVHELSGLPSAVNYSGGMDAWSRQRF